MAPMIEVPEPAAPPAPPDADVLFGADRQEGEEGAAPANEEAPAAKRRSRRKSVVGRQTLADARKQSLAAMASSDAMETPRMTTRRKSLEASMATAARAAMEQLEDEPEQPVEDAEIEPIIAPNVPATMDFSMPIAPEGGPGESEMILQQPREEATGEEPSLETTPQEEPPPPREEAPVESTGASLPVVALPPDADLQSATDETSLLALALRACVSAATRDGAVSTDSSTWSAVRNLLLKLGSIASMLRGRSIGGKQARVVRFAVHDLSCVAPPKLTKPGSEVEQEHMIGELVDIMRAQHSLLPTSWAAKSSDEEARVCLTYLLAALTEMATAVALVSDMRASATFYGGELSRWLSDADAPMLLPRLSERLSSSLRLHLSAVLSEVEEAAEPDATLVALHSRVHQHAVACGYTVPSGDEAAEHFAAFVTYNLSILCQHGHLVCEGTPARSALAPLASDLLKWATAEADSEEANAVAAKAATAVHAAAPEDTEALIQWATAHAVLRQTFGPSEPLSQLVSAPLNVPHFEAVSRLAGHVYELGLVDEAYLSPLRDLTALQEALQADEFVSIGLLEAVRFSTTRGVGSSRRSRRR